MSKILVKSPVLTRLSYSYLNDGWDFICNDFVRQFFGSLPKKMLLILSAQSIRGGKIIRLSINNGNISMNGQKQYLYWGLYHLLLFYLTKENKRFYLKMVDLDK